MFFMNFPIKNDFQMNKQQLLNILKNMPRKEERKRRKPNFSNQSMNLSPIFISTHITQNLSSCSKQFYVSTAIVNRINRHSFVFLKLSFFTTNAAFLLLIGPNSWIFSTLFFFKIFRFWQTNLSLDYFGRMRMRIYYDFIFFQIR